MLLRSAKRLSMSKRQSQTVLTIWLTESCLEFFASQLGQVG
jgi:hypothetical protein